MARLETLQTLTRSLGDRGRRPAVIALQREGLERWSYEELAECVQRLANGLLRAGVQRGEPVAVMAPNSPQWVAACLATFETGAVVMPIDVQLSRDELGLMLEDSAVRWAFTTADHGQRLGELAPELRQIRLDADETDERSWRRYWATGPTDIPGVGPQDVAALFYTSGTTGPPKGVPLTHRNLVSNLEALLEQGIARADDRVLAPLPLHHVYPFATGMLTPLALGAPLIIPYSLTGPQVLRALQEGEATVIVGVPRLYAALYSAIETRVHQRSGAALAVFRGMLRLSMFLRRRLGFSAGRRLFAPLHRRFGPHLRLVASGGSALDPELAWKLEGLGWTVATGYGLTETSPILTFNPPGEGRLDSAGRVLPGVEVRIDQPDPQTGRGEVLARGPNVFAGYRNRPDKTSKAFTDDGWFRTGDLGYLDQAGYLHLVGRASEMIVLTGGENINPERIEEQLQQGEHIREAGVLEWGNRLAAVLVPEPAAMREEVQDLEQVLRRDVEQLSRELPTHHRLGEYVISHDPIPRTRLGKVRRHKLKERYEQLKQAGGRQKEEPGPVPIERLAPEDQQILQDPAARQVWDWLGDRYPDLRLTPDLSPQLDLGVDSMEWLNLTLELRERVGVELGDNAIGRIETVRDLLREVAEAGRAEGAAADPVELLKEPERLLDERQRRWLEPPHLLARGAGRFLIALNRLLMKPFRIQVAGLENLPTDTPFVLTPNHASFLDPPALGAVLDTRVLERTYWGGWTGLLFNNPLARGFSRATRVIPVDPRHGVLSSLAFGAAAIRRGNNLVWFPEGERSWTGELQQFRSGIGLLLQAQRVPAVPVWIEGAHEALPRDRRLPRLHPITITFGKAMRPEELEREGPGKPAHERIATILHDRVADLRRHARKAA
jgi:long-chain acyl-CoA synthetase